MNISFGGAQIKRPGAYSVVDSSGMTPTTLGSFNILCVIGGMGTGGTASATAVTWFNSPVTAKTKIGDGITLEVMRLAWKHGADLIAFSPVTNIATPADWQTAIDRLEDEYVDGIIPATTLPAVQAMVMTHVNLMSSVDHRRERRAFYGHANGLDATAVALLQTALNTERGIMATPGIYNYDIAGNRVLLPSYYLASCYAGLWAGKESQDPITYDYVQVAGLETIYNEVEITSLLTAHIAPTEYVRNKGFRIVQGVTLSNSADLTKCELSVCTLKDVMSMNIREDLEERFVGTAGIADIEVTMYNRVITLLEKFKTANWITSYVKDSVAIVKDGTGYYVDWEGKPTLPINNFFITSHFTL